ncbi:MAG: DUF1538 domain-containing protein [Tissierellia bacterium]|nr:DUF1538 domain-containing protein [Tissierellia bacterium]
MNILSEKIKEVASSTIPVVLLVLALTFTIVDVELDLLIRFLIGAFLVLIGLSVFLMGIDLSMISIGDHMAEATARSRSLIGMLVLSFLLGFLVTVAEPDLLILGDQVEKASAGAMGSTFMVYIVSIGVGIMIALGVIRVMKSKPLNKFMAITYGIILVLSIFVADGFMAIAFDASGATTGALTTPFVLALCAGLARAKGGKSAEDDSFGLVGIMSAGPILAVMLMAIITGQKEIHGTAEIFAAESGIIQPIIRILPSIFLESVIALVPITSLFFIYNFVKFKIPRREIKEIIIGLFFTIFGLTLFLTGVNSGFMDMGKVIGIEIASGSLKLLPLIGLFLGLIVVLAEPAVHVLGHQVETVTNGHIPVKLLKLTLSIGVGLAISLSMVRIMVPEVRLWYFLLPGFLIGIILSFKADPIFVGIAYDAGGVASGPMTATFVLAFAQGAAMQIPTADVIVDGFGVIAMVAMSPVLCVMILGVLFKMRESKHVLNDIEDDIQVSSFRPDLFSKNDCLLITIDRDLSDEAIQLAREVGARGATVVHGRKFKDVEEIFLSFEIPEEKDLLIMVVDNEISLKIMEALEDKMNLESSDFSMLPTEAFGISG